MVIHRLVHLLPRQYQAGLTGAGGGEELEPSRKC
jgi:hypothetical protein